MAAPEQEGGVEAGGSGTVGRVPKAGRKRQTGEGAKDPGKGAPGGKANDAQRKNYEDCIAAYDPATNMTRAEWAATCRRTLREYPEIR